MMSNALLDAPSPIDRSADDIEQEILTRINEQDVVSLDALTTLLPHYSWNQIFHAVDRLARRGGIVLRRHRFDYTLFSTHYAA
jgi:hypothetical protein